MTRWVLTVFLVCVASLSLWVAYKVLVETPVASDQVTARRTTERPIQGAGLDFSEYKSGQITFRVKAEEFNVRPRKFGVFRVKSVNEAFLKDLHLEDYSFTQNGEDGALDSTQQESKLSAAQILANGLGLFLKSRELGRVQRAVIDRMRTMSFSAPGAGKKLERVISAKHAVFDVKEKQLKMQHARVELVPLKRRLTASQLVWDDRNELWLVEKKGVLWDHSEKVVLEQGKLDKFLQLVD